MTLGVVTPGSPRGPLGGARSGALPVLFCLRAQPEGTAQVPPAPLPTWALNSSALVVPMLDNLGQQLVTVCASWLSILAGKELPGVGRGLS